jgi:hypothetical protein
VFEKNKLGQRTRFYMTGIKRHAASSSSGPQIHGLRGVTPLPTVGAAQATTPY